MAEMVGTNIMAPLVPLDSADTYPTHIAAYGQGGWRSVENLDARDSIHFDKLEEGMAVYVKSIDKEYTLDSIDPIIWRERIFSSNGGGGTGVDNIETVIESTNGNIFKPGQPLTTYLIAHVFQGGEEVTDIVDASRFRWRRVSFYPLPPPNDDETWNNLYRTGYKTISITTSSVYSRATFHCDILIN